jgi:hypothetical protein
MIAIKEIAAYEIERLNKKGEYIKEVKQVKKFFGIPYSSIINKATNKITQKVIDETGAESDKGTKIGFGN